MADLPSCIIINLLEHGCIRLLCPVPEPFIQMGVRYLPLRIIYQTGPSADADPGVIILHGLQVNKLAYQKMLQFIQLLKRFRSLNTDLALQLFPLPPVFLKSCSYPFP